MQFNLETKMLTVFSLAQLHNTIYKINITFSFKISLEHQSSN